MSEKEKKENFKAVFFKYFRRDEALLLPNVLCYLRMILIPVFVTIYLLPSFVPSNEAANIYIATSIMLFSAYTDFLDGFIARKFSLTSNLGKVLDPIADKFMQLGVSIALVVKFNQIHSVLILLVIFILKELWMAVMNVIMARNNRAFGSAKWYGKVSTFLFYLIVGAIFIGGPLIGRNYTRYQAHLIIDSLVLISTFFLLLSSYKYTRLFLNTLKNGQEEVVKEKEGS